MMMDFNEVWDELEAQAKKRGLKLNRATAAAWAAHMQRKGFFDGGITLPAPGVGAYRQRQRIGGEEGEKRHERPSGQIESPAGPGGPAGVTHKETNS